MSENLPTALTITAVWIATVAFTLLLLAGLNRLVRFFVQKRTP